MTDCRLFKPATTFNSLQSSWGESKQEQWQKKKQAVVAEAARFYLVTKPTFIQYYLFLADCRYGMAIELSQNDESLFGIFRNNPLLSFITDYNMFRDFYPYLVKRYQELRKLLPIKRVEFKDEKFLYFIPGVRSILGMPEYVEIKYNGELYTKLMGVNALTYDKKLISYILILSYFTPSICNLLDKAEQTLAPLYDQLCAPQENIERIRTIKFMVWHLAHAMLRRRGSATITETLAESLCLAYQIKYTYPSNAIPLDLIALFCPDPETFAKSVVLSHDLEVEFKHELPKIALLSKQ